MPNAKVLESKKQIVAELKEKMANAASCVLVDYKGINVADDTKLRKELREANVKYTVVKNTLLKLAAQEAEIAIPEEVLNGTTALAISAEDPIAPARILCKFAKDADKLEVKAGVVEGTVYDEAGVKALATIPSREELLSKLLGSIQSPIANFARVIKQIAEQGGAVAETAEAVEAPVEAAEAPVEAVEAPVEE